MSAQSTPLKTDDQRLRFRFRKEGDLRWISHRDLVRVWERLCRRAGLTLRMSEGFHPKPKLMFPSALALGTEGRDEVVELVLTQPLELPEIQRRLVALAPTGLVVTAVQAVDTHARKARVRSMAYRFPVPPERRRQVEQAVAQLQACSSLPVERDGRREPVDVMVDLESVEWCESGVRFCIRASHQASVRPRDVLQILGLTDLEQQGYFLTRSEVELTS